MTFWKSGSNMSNTILTGISRRDVNSKKNKEVKESIFRLSYPTSSCFSSATVWIGWTLLVKCTNWISKVSLIIYTNGKYLTVSLLKKWKTLRVWSGKFIFWDTMLSKTRRHKNLLRTASIRKLRTSATFSWVRNHRRTANFLHRLRATLQRNI